MAKKQNPIPGLQLLTLLALTFYPQSVCLSNESLVFKEDSLRIVQKWSSIDEHVSLEQRKEYDVQLISRIRTRKSELFSEYLKSPRIYYVDVLSLSHPLSVIPRESFFTVIVKGEYEFFIDSDRRACNFINIQNINLMSSSVAIDLLYLFAELRGFNVVERATPGPKGKIESFRFRMSTNKEGWIIECSMKCNRTGYPVRRYKAFITRGGKIKTQILEHL